MTPPLEGLRVIDVGTRISAPFCAGLLGEMGAEVIKVELPGAGDFMREIGPFVDTDDDGPGHSLFWAVEGRGRKGCTVDLRQADGQDLFRRLCSTADVVCENFRPSTMERWHIGPEDLDPRLVMVRISVFGQDGPSSLRPGLDRLGIGYGGLLNLTGYPDRPPVRPGVTVSDYLTGVFAAQAAMAALYRRDARAPDRVRSSMRFCTGPFSAFWNGPSPATTGSECFGSVKATASPTRLPSTTTPPPMESSCASSRAATRTSTDCARPWTARTWPTTHGSLGSPIAPPTAS